MGRLKGEIDHSIADRYRAAQAAWHYHLLEPVRDAEKHERLWRELKTAEHAFYSPVTTTAPPLALSPSILRWVEFLFAAESRNQAVDILERRCGVSLCQGYPRPDAGSLTEDDLAHIEQIRRSVVIESNGSVEELKRLVAVAEEDDRYIPLWPDDIPEPSTE